MATTFNKEVKVNKSAITAKEFIESREKLPAGLQTLLLHTRHQTKGDVKISGNNHPVIYKTCFAIHNGSINNDDDLFEEEKLQRNFQVDTEIIPALFDKYGLTDEEALKKSLEKLQGPMAAAVIDPINFHGKLVLARGSHTPLNVLNTKNFIVWASTTIAMREAWAKVFGTPPEFSKFNQFPEGKAWLVDGAEIIEFDFKVNRPLYAASGWRPSHVLVNRHARRHGVVTTSGYGDGKDSFKPWEGPHSLFITERAYKDAVKDYRDKAIDDVARIWSERGLYEEAELTDVRGKNIEWLPCICGESVVRQDMRYHVRYKHICMDCQTVILNAYRNKADQAANRSKIMLTEEEAEACRQWAEVDAEAHELILDMLIEKSSLTGTTIEYLLYRAPTGQPKTPYGKATRAATQWLRNEYAEVEKEVWETMSDELLAPYMSEETVATDKPEYAAFQKISNGIRHLWYRCSTHDTVFRHGDACEHCEGKSLITGRRVPRYPCGECGQEFPRYQITKTEQDYSVCDECFSGAERACPVPELRALPAGTTSGTGVVIDRCPECKTWLPKTQALCRVCEVKPPLIPDHCSGKTQTGRPCKRKVKFCLGNHGFCNNHWGFCHRKKCNATAKHMNSEGVRICHDHARRQIGFKADTMTIQEGATIMEVQ